MSLKIDISFNKLIHALVCLYAFFIPLEEILNVFFGIDTIFKPYRVLALLIIFLFVIKLFYRWDRNKEIKQDIFLYLIFIYGVIITLYRMMTTNFHFGYLYNDIFQTGLYLAVFIVIRHISLTYNRMIQIIKFLVAGIVVNALYVFNEFFILSGYGRKAGFMDNPNYLGLSIVAAVLFLLLRRYYLTNWLKKIALIFLLLILVYVFTIAGSRSSLAVLLVCLLFVFYFSRARDKGILLAFLIPAFVIMGMGGFDNLLGKQSSLPLVNRIQKEHSEDNRIPIWAGIYRASEATNFLGLGVGQFKARFHEFYYDENNMLIRRMLERRYFLSPHSDYFAILVVYGIIGLIFYLVFLLFTGRKILHQLRHADQIEYKKHYQYCLLIFLSIVLFGITAESLNSALFWILLCTCSTLEFAASDEELLT